MSEYEEIYSDIQKSCFQILILYLCNMNKIQKLKQDIKDLRDQLDAWKAMKDSEKAAEWEDKIAALQDELDDEGNKHVNS